MTDVTSSFAVRVLTHTHDAHSLFFSLALFFIPFPHLPITDLPICFSLIPSSFHFLKSAGNCLPGFDGDNPLSHQVGDVIIRVT